MRNDNFSRREWLVQTAVGLAAAGQSASAADPPTWTLAETLKALQQRKISSTELVKLCVARIRRLDSSLNSFITLTEEAALAQARICDEKRGGTELLHGVPLALKDNIDTAGIRTTAAARVFAERVPTEDAEVTRRLKVAGIVLLGKLNLDEMAFAGTGTTGCFGPVHNPWNGSRISGGSSAGSAAAVAAGFCFGSVGSDDGGSVRIPSAHCGVVGLKTSYGRVSTRGVVPSAYSTDTVGPIVRTVEDAAILLQVLAGYDPQDAITADEPAPDYLREMRKPITSLRIGVPRRYFFEQLDAEVAAAVEEAIRLLRPKVRAVRDVVLPRLEIPEHGDYDVELLHYQKPFFDKHPDWYHPRSQRMLNSLKSVETLPYIETLRRIRECRRAIRETFQSVDVLVLPTMREPAPSLEETLNDTHRRPPSNVAAFNHFGVPAITVPCGFSRNNLPIGLQIAGPAFQEGRVLQVAYAYQQATGWHTRRPPLN